MVVTAWLAAACNPCNSLCADVARALDRCMTESFTWEDLGARDRADWRGQCQSDWDRTAARLNSRELEVAVDVCAIGRDELADLDCDAIVALYGPL